SGGNATKSLLPTANKTKKKKRLIHHLLFWLKLPSLISSYFHLRTPKVITWDVAKCTGLLLLWLLSCCPPLDVPRVSLAHLPVCPPMLSVQQRTPARIKPHSSHPPTATYSVSDDNITTSSSFPLIINSKNLNNTQFIIIQ
ncbi:hypothetical protein AMECASPLE_038232, partial [Ameca splendens]